MSTLRYNDTWGKELTQRSRNSSNGISSKLPRALPIEKLGLLLTFFSNLSKKEQQVFILKQVAGVTSPSEMASLLKWSSRGAVYNTSNRMNAKLDVLWPLMAAVEPQEDPIPETPEAEQEDWSPIYRGNGVQVDVQDEDQDEDQEDDQNDDY
jgi:hypothetical protein